MNYTPTAPTRLLFVDSANRDQTLFPNGNNYVLHLTRPIRNIERVDLVSARVPNTMYNVSAGGGPNDPPGANVLQIPSASQTVSIPPGFYSVYDLATALTTAAAPLTVTYLAWAGKFLFSSQTAFTLVFSSAFGALMGFPSGKTLTSALAPATLPTFAGQQVLMATSLPHMNPNDQIFLDIDELKTPAHVYTGGLTTVQNQVGSQSLTQVTVTGANTERAFAPITMDVGTGCMKHFSENRDYSISAFYPEPINSLQRLTIRWLDASGTPLNFNGADWNSFILRLHLHETVVEGDPEDDDPLEKRVAQLEIMRMVEDVNRQAAQQSESLKAQKKKGTPFGKWTVILLALLSVLGYVLYKNFRPPE